MCDNNDNGKLSLDELKKCLTKYGDAETYERFKEVAEADAGTDHIFNKKEFNVFANQISGTPKSCIKTEW